MYINREENLEKKTEDKKPSWDQESAVEERAETAETI